MEKSNINFTIKLLILFTTLLTLSCSKDNHKIYPIRITYTINNTEIDIKDNFIISIIKAKDTTHFYPNEQIINFKKFDEFNNYKLIFRFNKKTLLFNDLSNKMLNPSEKMEWKFGIESKPFNTKNGVLSSVEYNDKTIKKVEYLQFNPLEFSDGIEKVNILRE